MALEGKELDANFFQHKPYLDDFNKEKGTKLVSIGTVHYEPFGIYAGKTKSLGALKDGAMVAVPNDTTNEARALLLLQSNGLIKLKAGALSAEKADSIAATTYANILAVRAGDENRPELKALIDALKSDQVKEFMTKKYEGAVVPAN